MPVAAVKLRAAYRFTSARSDVFDGKLEQRQRPGRSEDGTRGGLARALTIVALVTTRAVWNASAYATWGLDMDDRHSNCTFKLAAS